VEELRRDMDVKTLKGGKKVVGIVRTELRGGGMDLCEIGSLVVTPWHPIKLDSGKWVFPAEVVEPKPMGCPAVYSILLGADSDSDAHSVCVGGVWCVTLGHGVTASSEKDVRAHAFLGSYDDCFAVMKKRMEGSSSGVMEATGIKRDGKAGLMSGFVWKQMAQVSRA